MSANTEKKGTRVDVILNGIKNHKYASIFIVLIIIVIFSAKFTNALEDLYGFYLYRILGEPTRESLVAEYCELLAPMIVQLDRTQSAFDRWTSKNLYLEAKIIREGNESILILLQLKSSLIQIDLRDDRRKLIEHYDRWLEEFDRVRGGREPDTNQQFVFVGPEGYPFPRESADRFRKRFTELQEKLGPSPCN